MKTFAVLTSGHPNIVLKSQELEDLLEDFNETFGSIFAMDMLNLIVTQILSTFLIGLFIVMEEFGPVATTMFSFIINSFAIFAFCNVIEEFNQEIKKLASSLKRQESLPCTDGAINVSMLHSHWISRSVGIVPDSFLSLGRTTCTNVNEPF